MKMSCYSNSAELFLVKHLMVLVCSLSSFCRKMSGDRQLMLSSSVVSGLLQAPVVLTVKLVHVFGALFAQEYHPPAQAWVLEHMLQQVNVNGKFHTWNQNYIVV